MNGHILILERGLKLRLILDSTVYLECQALSRWMETGQVNNWSIIDLSRFYPAPHYKPCEFGEGILSKDGSSLHVVLSPNRTLEGANI